MCSTDEFGNSRLLPATFLKIFAVSCLAMVVSSQSIWGTPPDAGAGAAMAKQPAPR